MGEVTPCALSQVWNCGVQEIDGDRGTGEKLNVIGRQKAGGKKHEERTVGGGGRGRGRGEKDGLREEDGER